MVMPMLICAQRMALRVFVVVMFMDGFLTP
jgi:hypothetical protein